MFKLWTKLTCQLILEAEAIKTEEQNNTHNVEFLDAEPKQISTRQLVETAIPLLGENLTKSLDLAINEIADLMSVGRGTAKFLHSLNSLQAQIKSKFDGPYFKFLTKKDLPRELLTERLNQGLLNELLINNHECIKFDGENVSLIEYLRKSYSYLLDFNFQKQNLQTLRMRKKDISRR